MSGLGAGVHDISLAEYLKDPAPTPSLSAGIAKTLLDLSPAHAFHAYNEERQNYRRDGSIGTVFHALFLGKGADYEVIEADDFRTKAAREQRDVALCNGKTPIKAADFDTAAKMVEHAVIQLEAHEIGNFTNRPGKAEQVLIWREGETYCRACCDWLPADLETEGAIYDLKTSSCAHPDVWSRRVFSTGYDLSAAHYLRGVLKTTGHATISYRFVVIENRPPYALSVIDLSPAALFMAEKRRAAAAQLWGECLARGRWPAYPARVATIDLPPYLEAQQTEHELGGRYDPAWLDNLIEMSAP